MLCGAFVPLAAVKAHLSHNLATARLLRLGHHGMVLWNGAGSGKLASMARVERQAGAYLFLWLPAAVTRVRMQSDGNGV